MNFEMKPNKFWDDEEAAEDGKAVSKSDFTREMYALVQTLQACAVSTVDYNDVVNLSETIIEIYNTVCKHGLDELPKSVITLPMEDGKILYRKCKCKCGKSMHGADANFCSACGEKLKRRRKL